MHEITPAFLPLEAIETPRGSEFITKISVGVLHTDTMLPLAAEQLFYFLYHQAKDTIQKENKFQVRVRDALTYLGQSHNDYKYFEKIIDYLMSPFVTLNILNKDRVSNFRKAHFIVSPVCEDGVLTWKYDDNLLPILRDPKVYTFLEPFKVNGFTSQYEMAFYKFFRVCLIKRNGHVIVSTTLDDLRRKILHLEDEQYAEFKILHRDIIKKYVSQVCEKIDLQVDYSFKRSGRKVVGIDWDIRDLKFQNTGPETQFENEKATPDTEESLTDDATKIQVKLAEYAFTWHKNTREAINKLRQNPYGLSEDEVNLYLLHLIEQVDLQQQRNKSGQTKSKVFNAGGLLRTLVLNEVYLDGFLARRQQERQHQEKKRQSQMQEHQIKYEKKLEALHAAYQRERLKQLLLEHLDTSTDSLLTALRKSPASRMALQRCEGSIKKLVESDPALSLVLSVADKLDIGFSIEPFDKEAWLTDSAYEVQRTKVLKELHSP